MFYRGNILDSNSPAEHASAMKKAIRLFKTLLTPLIHAKKAGCAAIILASVLVCNNAQAAGSNIPNADTTGENFLGGLASEILAPEKQFMPISYTMFEGTPGAAATAAGTPLYNRSAVTAIIESMRNLTVIPKTAQRTGKQSAAYWTWNICMMIAVYGLLHSGILTFLKIAREGAPIGQSVISYIIKIGIVIGMFAWVIGGAPRAMIRIVDLLNGFDNGTVKFEASKGTLSEQDYKDATDRLKNYNGRENDAGMDQRERIAQTQMLPAAAMFKTYLEKARKEVAKHNDIDAKLKTGSIAALLNRLHTISMNYDAAWKRGCDFGAYGKVSSGGSLTNGNPNNPEWALGKDLNSFLYGGANWRDNGEESDVITRSKDVATKLNLAYFSKIYNQVAATLGHTLQNPMHLSGPQVTTYNTMPPQNNSRLTALFGAIPTVDMAPGMYGPSEAVPDNSAIMLNAFPPNDIDWDEVKRPNAVVEGALHTAGLMLGISIWGLPLALLMWTAMYALPDQLQIGGVLTKSINVALTVALTGLMLGGAYAWGCEITSPGKTVVETLFGDNSGTLSELTIKNVIAGLTGSTSSAILLAMYIIAIPGIAAKIVQGSNGFADGMTKSLDAGGRVSQLATMAGGLGEANKYLGGVPGKIMGAAQSINPASGLASSIGSAALRTLSR